MIIKDFDKFEVDYKRNHTSLVLFDSIYNKYVNKMLITKARNLIYSFNNDISNTKLVSSYTAYEEYIFVILLEKLNKLISIYQDIEQKKIFVQKNITEDMERISNIRDEIQNVLSLEFIEKIQNNKEDILSTYYLAILENVNGFTNTLIKKRHSSMLGKDSFNIIEEVNKKINEISLEASYESHCILFFDCIDKLDKEVYREVLDHFDVIMSNVGMSISKIKFDVNTFNIMGYSKHPGEFYNLLHYIQDIEYFIHTLVIFHDLHIEKPTTTPIEEFTNIYNEGANCTFKPFLSEKLKVISKDYKYFYEQYQEFSMLPDHSKQITYVTNKIINYLEHYLRSNDFLHNDVKEGIFETIQMKITNITNNFSNVTSNNYDLDEFIVDVLIKECASLQEIIVYSFSKLDEFEDENFILNFEILFYNIISSLKNCGVENFKPIVGEKFDSKLHDVEQVQPSSQYQKGSVLKVILKGYSFKSKVVLKSKVVCAS